MVPYLLLAPALIGIVLLQLYPFILGMWYAFNEIALVNINEQTFVGLRNFETVVNSRSPAFWSQVVANSAVFTAGSVGGQILCGLGLSILLQQRWVVWRDFFRALYFIPWIIANVIVGYTWRFMYDPRMGFLNSILMALGAEPISWLAEPRLTMPALIVANIWQGVGFSLILLTAGLQSIPDEVYDAAVVDGASDWQSVLHITLPLLRPFLLINLIIASVATINVFDIIFVMTGGGPLYRTEVLPLFMYRLAFDMGYIGRGAAVATLIFLVGVLLTLVYLAWLRTEEVD
jgi:multiple sugar transport system permease protein